MSQTKIDLLDDGVKANFADSHRKGNVIELGAVGDVFVCGDIHGHRRNFEKFFRKADLPNHPDRHVILQEIIHGGPDDGQGGCISYRLLFDAVELKVRYPDRVHIIMGNHDTAYISQKDVLKNGREMNSAMTAAIKREFGDDAVDVENAIKNFLFSQPLAVKCENGIWISHSLPVARFIDLFDTEIFNRDLRPEDLKKPASGYLLTWGRNQTEEVIDKLSEMLDAKLFICGHQTQEKGWLVVGQKLIIIASEHNHGCALGFSLEKNYNAQDMLKQVFPLASIE
jgi:hypothetical protein